jgi:hypothetical protein
MESELNDGAALLLQSTASRPSENDALLLQSTGMSTGPHMEEVHGPGDVTIDVINVHSPSGRDKLTDATPAVGTKHGSNAMLAEDVLEIVIPFLVMESPAHTMCDPKEGRTPICKTGEHVHVWCRSCAELPIDHHCGATHDACPDCRTLRTITQLSRRWDGSMWERYQ